VFKVWILIISEYAMHRVADVYIL